MQGINIVGYQALEVAGTVVSLTLPDAAKRVHITCEDDDVRWRADGTPPATGEGHVLAQDDSISFTSANYRSMLEAIQFSKVSTTAALKITYFD